MRAIVYSLFFLSGAFGLVYQVVWSRVLTEVFGTTVLAVGTVLAAFMSGLALGSWWLGRRADTSENPLRLYARYEVGIALTAPLAHLLLNGLAPVYSRLHLVLGESGLLLTTGRFVVGFVLVMAPTVLMGATLPILARHVTSRLDRLGSSLGALYAVNTAGAVAGSLAAGFFLIRAVGLHGAVAAAAAGNLAVGVVAWIASRRTEISAPDLYRSPAGEDRLATAVSAEGRLVLVLFGLSGFATFAYEIYWTRALVFLFGNSTYAFTTMLTAFLAGIALGGWWIRTLADSSQNRLALFGGIQVLIGIGSAAALPLLFFLVGSERVQGLLADASGGLGAILASRFAVALAVLLVPATLIGATFPLAGRIYVHDLDRTGEDVGRVYAVNTLGNVAGALLAGAVLLRVYGVQRGIALLACLNVALGLFALLHRTRARSLARAAAATLAVAAAVGLAAGAPWVPFPSEFQGPDDRVLFYEEGVSATTKVFADTENGEKRMSIDGIVIGGTGITDYKQQILAHLPKLLLDRFGRELSVGLGSGILAGESARHSGVREVVCLEIEPSVVRGAQWFEEENHGLLTDPRARIVVDDVGHFLRTTAGKYDVVSADEKTADTYASNGFSYSLDYYRLLAARLEPHGLVVQWVPNDLPPSQYRMVLKTFTAAFPHVTLWYFPPADKLGASNSILVGSLRPVRPAVEQMRAAFAGGGEAFASLRQYGLESAEAVLAHFVSDEGPLRDAVADAPINRLSHPRFEFYSPVDYAIPVNDRVLANHDLLVVLRGAHRDAILSAAASSGEAGRVAEAWDAEDEFLRGFRLQLGGAPFEAVTDHLFAAVSLAPWNDNLRRQVQSYLWNAAGRRFLRGDYGGSAAIMGSAVQVYPEDGEARYEYGATLRAIGRNDLASREMEAALSREPRLLAPRRFLAEAALGAGRIEEARSHLRAILEVDPNDPWAAGVSGRLGSPPGARAAP